MQVFFTASITGKKHYMKNYVKIINKTSIKLKINTVVCKQNIDDIQNIAKIIKKYKVKRWKIFQRQQSQHCLSIF